MHSEEWRAALFPVSDPGSVRGALSLKADGEARVA